MTARASRGVLTVMRALSKATRCLQAQAAKAAVGRSAPRSSSDFRNGVDAVAVVDAGEMIGSDEQGEHDLDRPGCLLLLGKERSGEGALSCPRPAGTEATAAAAREKLSRPQRLRLGYSRSGDARPGRHQLGSRRCTRRGQSLVNGEHPGNGDPASSRGPTPSTRRTTHGRGYQTGT